jgi:hypothetical protein
MKNMHRLKNIKINENEEIERVMRGNIPELQEGTQVR